MLEQGQVYRLGEVEVVRVYKLEVVLVCMNEGRVYMLVEVVLVYMLVEVVLVCRLVEEELVRRRRRESETSTGTEESDMGPGSFTNINFKR